MRMALCLFSLFLLTAATVATCAAFNGASSLIANVAVAPGR